MQVYVSTGGAIERVLAAGAGPKNVPSYLDAVKVSLLGVCWSSLLFFKPRADVLEKGRPSPLSVSSLHMPRRPLLASLARKIQFNCIVSCEPVRQATGAQLSVQPLH